jgi:hypothetical protein
LERRHRRKRQKVSMGEQTRENANVRVDGKGKLRIFIAVTELALDFFIVS